VLATGRVSSFFMRHGFSGELETYHEASWRTEDVKPATKRMYKKRGGLDVKR